MRAIPLVILLALTLPSAAMAQTAATAAASAASAPAARARGGDITREEYIERAVERAKRAAATRFDRMDANHDRVLTADERRAARSERATRRGSPSAQ